MKRNLIALALVAGLTMANSASAQSFDDRWYLTFGGGYGFFDGDRNVENELYGTLGVGKFITPNFSLDLELFHSNPKLDYDYLDEERNWELMGLSLTGRYHFGEADRWRPYVAFGLGTQEHHDGTQRQALRYGFNPSRTGNDMVGILGFGVQGGLWGGSLRAEIGERFDMDDGGDNPIYIPGGPVINPLGLNGDNDEDGSYYDGYIGLSFVLPLGDRDEPVPVAVVPQKTCADLDDDGDGVNNCDDKCPGTAAGTGIGSDGCPLPAPEPAPVEEPKPFRG